jgi:hypothetical protein
MPPIMHTFVPMSGLCGSMFVVRSTLLIPESDDLLDLEPTTDGMGYATKVMRRREDGSVIWSARRQTARRRTLG